MQLEKKIYTATRGECEEYQTFEATMEMAEGRRYVTLDLGYMMRWRSKAEMADYLRWVADQVETIPED